MNTGLSNSQLKFLKEKIVNPVEEKGGKVFLFGSRATGKYREYSDIDILVRGFFSEEQKELVSKIKELLEESNFPYIVDIVLDQDLADAYRSTVEEQLIGL